jgi:hypothetical protein
MPVLLSFASTGEVSTCVVSTGQWSEYVAKLAKHSTSLKGLRDGSRLVSPNPSEKSLPFVDDSLGFSYASFNRVLRQYIDRDIDPDDLLYP